MAKKILIAVGAVVGICVLVIAVLGAMAPTDLHVEREVVIEKPVAIVFSDLLLGEEPRPVESVVQEDPNIVKEYKGEDGTVGFVSSWSGNNEVGVGEQEIKKIAENQRIDYELRFKKPMEDTSTAYLITEAQGENQTKVKWGMQGKTPFPGNVICMVMNMKEKLATEFDSGLAMLKKRCESEPAQLPNDS